MKQCVPNSNRHHRKHRPSLAGKTSFLSDALRRDSNGDDLDELYTTFLSDTVLFLSWFLVCFWKAIDVWARDIGQSGSRNPVSPLLLGPLDPATLVGQVDRGRFTSESKSGGSCLRGADYGQGSLVHGSKQWSFRAFRAQSILKSSLSQHPMRRDLLLVSMASHRMLQ
jgi:hypothetical protein